jgi:hypothetical protein
MLILPISFNLFLRRVSDDVNRSFSNAETFLLLK